MNIVYHIFCYIVCFIGAMSAVWYGERKTRYRPPKNEEDFEDRMVVTSVGMFILIILHALLTLRTW